MTNNVIVRFPAIAEMIFNQLENCSIANCRKVNESWRSFIDDQKLPWIRKIQKFSGSLTGFHDQWIQIIARTPINVVKELAVNVEIFFKANPKRNEHRWPPHFIAADQGCLDLYKYIAQKTGCINARNSRNSDGYELFEAVYAKYRKEIIEENSSPFVMAIMKRLKGNSAICKFIIENSENKCLNASNGVTMLHLAARYGNLELCQMLLENLSDKSPRTIKGWTPLHEAASFGHVEVFKHLSANMPDKNQSNKNGYTVLHCAACFDRLDICKFLIENQADVNVQDSVGRTPLHEAAANGNLDVCRLLMENVEDKNPQDFNAWTPFHSAAAKGHLKVCKLFIDNINDRNPIDLNANTPLKMALTFGHLEVSKLITNNVEDENLKSNPVSSFFYIFMLFFLLPFYDNSLIIDKWPIQSLILYCGYVVGHMIQALWITLFCPSYTLLRLLLYIFSIASFIGIWSLVHYFLKRAKQLQNI